VANPRSSFISDAPKRHQPCTRRGHVRNVPRSTYTETLRRLREATGDQLPVAALTPEIYEQTMARCDQGAANTWNKHLSTLTSFTAYCRRQDWLTTDPGRRLERRKVSWTRDKAIPRTRLDRLFTDDRNPLRDRGRGGCSTRPAPAPKRSSASTCPTSTWSSDAPWSPRRAAIAPTCTGNPTARLLPRLLAGRTTGPVFLADRRAPAAGRRVPALSDICPDIGAGSSLQGAAG
jgi:hypothetical protein